MKYQQTIDYTVPSDRLLAIFSEPDFVLEKYAAQGASNIRLLKDERDGDRVRFTVTRDVAVQVDVPAFARSLVPSTITLIQTDSWDSATRQGSLEIEFQGMPVKLRCDMRLEDRAGLAHHVLDFDIQVSVPLIGGKLEKLLADDLQMKFKHDTEVSLRIVASRG